jgi:hypothetical protein
MGRDAASYPYYLFMSDLTVARDKILIKSAAWPERPLDGTRELAVLCHRNLTRPPKISRNESLLLRAEVNGITVHCLEVLSIPVRLHQTGFRVRKTLN